MSLSNKLISSIVTAALFLSPACSSPEAKSKAELSRRGLELSETAFLERIKAGDVESLQLYLAAGMSPDAAEEGCSALLEAARRGYQEVALGLIGAGADVDAKDPYGVTALMFSFIAGSGGTAAALMEKGAEINARDVDGRTALFEALTTENDIPTEVILALIKRGADVNARTAEGVTPLMIAVYDHPAVVRALVEAGADVNARDANGASVLRMAKDNPENAKILREAGAVER